MQADQISTLPSEQMDHLLGHLLNGVAYCRMVYEQGVPVDFVYLYTNPAFHRQTGLGPVVGKHVSEVLPGIRESDPELLNTLGRVANQGDPEKFVMCLEALKQWFEFSVYCPQNRHFVALFNVVAEHKLAEQEMRERATQFQLVLEGSDLGFWDWNITSGAVDRNARWAHMLGYTHEEIQHTTQQWADFVHPGDRDRAWQSIWNAVEGRTATHKQEYRMLHKDGSIRWILDQAKVMQRDALGKAVRMCGTHTDITERKLLEEEFKRQAHVDYLTGVCNRRYFMECAENELQRSMRYGSALSLLMLDIDHFKVINDRYGHKIGDLVLQRMCNISNSTLRSVDVLGRMGGEEFAVLMPETGYTLSVEVANRLLLAIADTKVQIGGDQDVRFTVSIGVSWLLPPGDNVEALINRADAAMYEAKRTGRNRVS